MLHLVYSLLGQHGRRRCTTTHGVRNTASTPTCTPTAAIDHSRLKIVHHWSRAAKWFCGRRWHSLKHGLFLAATNQGRILAPPPRHHHDHRSHRCHPGGCMHHTQQRRHQPFVFERLKRNHCCSVRRCCNGGAALVARSDIVHDYTFYTVIQTQVFQSSVCRSDFLCYCVFSLHPYKGVQCGM